MAMLPIFLIGLLCGGLCGYAFALRKKETPSDVKLHLQEVNIISLKEDIRLLEEANQELRDIINAGKIKEPVEKK